MDSIIVHFTLLWLLFQTVNSEKSESTSFFKEILNQIGLEGSQNANSTHLDDQDLILHLIVMDTQTRKLNFATTMFKSITETQKLKINTTKRITKMLGDLEEYRYSAIQSYKKEGELFDEYSSKKDMTSEDFLRVIASQQMMKTYEIYLAQLKKLKFKLYRWNNIQHSHLPSVSDEVHQIVNKFMKNEDIPSEVSSNDVNGEDSLPKFDDDADDQLERLQRLSLMIKDELFEMPKRKNEDEDDENSNMDPQNEFSEKIKVPRWLLTERDIEEIQNKYVKWMALLEESPHPNVASVKEKLLMSGYTLKSFCKTLAEFFNLTSILLECVSKDDKECEEMVVSMMDQEQFKKFTVHLHEWGMVKMAGL